MNLPLGFWNDENDFLHVSIPDFLFALGLPNTAENQELAMQEIARVMKEDAPERPVIYRPVQNERRYDVELDADGRPAATNN